MEQSQYSLHHRDPKHRTFFVKNETLQQEENETVEYKNYSYPFLNNFELVNNIKNQICGFLNNIGGRLYIGINDDRKVIGVRLNDYEKDHLSNDLVNLTRDFYPRCRNDKIKVYYLPIKDNFSNLFIKNLWIIKITVKQGQTCKLYSVTSKYYRSYIRLQGQCVQLNTMEIEEYLLSRHRDPAKSSEENNFVDPFPAIPNIEPSSSITAEGFNSKRMRKSQTICEIPHANIQLNDIRENFESKQKTDLPKPQTLSENKKEKVRLKENSIQSTLEKNAKVIITNLNLHITVEQVSNMLKDYQLDPNNPILINRSNMNRSAFAYVYFMNIHEATKAKLALDDTNTNGNKIKFSIL